MITTAGFDNEMRTESIVPIFQNIIDACQKLVKICLKNELALSPDVMAAADVIRSLTISSHQDTEHVETLKKVSSSEERRTS